MTALLLTLFLIAVLVLAGMAFLAAAARNLPLNPGDNLPPGFLSVYQPVSPQWRANHRAASGMMQLSLAMLEQSDTAPVAATVTVPAAETEDAYVKRQRLNAEHEAELLAKKASKKQWHLDNRERRLAVQKARRRDRKIALGKELVNARRRAAQLALWTPERKAQWSLEVKQRLARDKQLRTELAAAILAGTPPFTPPFTAPFTPPKMAVPVAQLLQPVLPPVHANVLTETHSYGQRALA